MITTFKLFEKNKTFNIKGEDVTFNISNNKIYEIDSIRSLNLSYHELVDNGLWVHIPNSHKKFAIGTSYSFLNFYDHFSTFNKIEIEKCIGQEILCIDDKAGPFGGRPTVTEGKLYELYYYNDKKNEERIKIKNDNDKFIRISPERFCKTQLNIDTIKYNL